MEWDLMVRINNCVNMHVQHIQWRSDSLIYYFGTSNGNQIGYRANDPSHVYSNPKYSKKILFLIWLGTSSLIQTS